ncbi:NAD(P)H oxidoreductase [Streptomyces sp. ISL-43]|uniref:NAD(P)H oxidoreductase n=1 Tax=Streptomyces sp. ISL-43 TaxID=2819183 RepID=UPI001BEC2295|nr:NAD(P)H oxidoreductase [Streptomyces sp. ISL-43]MBT2446850.1 NAD(P)H oxidoreductase [Streptomyces sp. ISL-43]
MSAALVVVAHPRTDSLTAQLARRAVARLEADGHTVDVLDLHAEGFDPRMGPEDEPDWSDPGKEYSAGTRAHMARIAAADLLVVVFPLWWFGLPAILKGWIDRVWNNGFAYGRRLPALKGKRMVWIPLVSYPEAKFKELGWDEPVNRLLRVGISEYCGIDGATVHFVYDSLSAGASALAEADAALSGTSSVVPGLRPGS